MTNLKLLTVNPTMFGMKNGVKLNSDLANNLVTNSIRLKEQVMLSSLKLHPQAVKLFVFKVSSDTKISIPTQSVNFSTLFP